MQVVSPLQMGVPNVMWEHRVIALGVVVLLGILLSFVMWRLSYRALPPTSARHKRVLVGERFNSSPSVHRFTRSAGVARDKVGSLFIDVDSSTDEEDPSIKRGLLDVHSGIQETWIRLLEPIPPFASRLLQLSALTAVFGSIAVSTTALVDMITSEPEYPSSPDVWTSVVDHSMALIEVGTELITAFPYGGFVLSLVFAYTMMLMELMYTYWWATSITLLVGAVVISILDWEIEAVETSIIEEKSDTAIRFVDSFLVVWATGVVIASIGDYAGFTELGAVFGFLASLTVGVAFLIPASRNLVHGIRRAASEARGRNPVVTAYLVVRKLWGVFAVLVAPLVAVYLIAGFSDGSFHEVLAALSNSSMDVQVVLLSVVLLFAVFLGIQLKKAGSALNNGIRTMFSKVRVRAVVFGSLAPILVLITTTAVLYGLFESPVIGVSGGVFAALGTRGLYVIGQRALYKASLFGGESAGRGSVVVQAYDLQDADEDTVYYAVIDGSVELLSHDLDEVVGEVVRITEELFEDGSYEPSLLTLHAEYAFEYGIVDREEVESKAHERVRKIVFDDLRSNDGVMHIEELDSDLQKYPSELVQERIKIHRRRGELRQKGDYVRLAKDPFDKSCSTGLSR